MGRSVPVNYLLDTHTLLWLEGDVAKLSTNAKAVITDDQNELYVSLASLWELQIKVRSGKLRLPPNLIENLVNQPTSAQLKLLSIKGEHILTFRFTPQFHKDPFDLMLITQAIYEGWPIVSSDAMFSNYPVTVIW